MEERNNSPFTDEEYRELVKKQEAGGVDLDKEGKGSLLSSRAAQRQGVLIRLMAAHGNDDIRQDLKLLNFASTDEGDEFISALNECNVLGMDPTPIINQAYARSAGQKHGFVQIIADALTHTTHTANFPKGYKPDKDQPRGTGAF